MFRYLLIFILISFSSFVLHGQVGSEQVGQNLLIVTKSGEVVKGSLQSVSDNSIELLNEQGQLEKVMREDIDYSKVLDQSTADMQTLENGVRIDEYNSNRYFISPSGYSIPKGKSYYENIGVFFNSFGFGVSDNFSLAVGAEILSTLYGNPILYISPRFHVEDEKGYAWSLGGTFLTSTSSNFAGIAVLQTAFTIGDRNNNFTIGAGYGFTTSSFSDAIVPITISGVKRLSRKVALVTDNFIILDDEADELSVLSAGVRLYITDSGAAVNLSLWRPLSDTGSLVAFPFASFSLPMK